jgi:hypothetical protein
MTFPPGTYAGTALLVEAVGIGPGTLITNGTTATGQTITYTITNTVNVPANTKIRIQLANVNNPPDPSNVLTVSITTRDPGNSIIDGPTATNSYNIKQIGTNDIADNSITSSKITDGIISITDFADDAITTPKIADNSIISTKSSESFMKRVTLLDNSAGNTLGWNPTGGTFEFVISEPNADFDTSHVSASVTASRIGGGSLIGIPCTAASVWPGGNAFTIRCGLSPSNSPPDGSELYYLVTSHPAHVS